MADEIKSGRDLQAARSKLAHLTNDALKETDAGKKADFDKEAKDIDNEITRFIQAGGDVIEKRFLKTFDDEKILNKAKDENRSDKKLVDIFDDFIFRIHDFRNDKGPDPGTPNIAKIIKDELSRESTLKTKTKQPPILPKVDEAVKTGVKPIIKLPTIGKKKSAQDQIAEIQLKRLKQEIRPRVSPKFSLPKIATERSTEIVIGSIIAIFLIEIGAGTKFTALWNYAFTNVGLDVITNPSQSIISNKPSTHIGPLTKGSDVISPLSEIGMGGAYANSWGYGNLLEDVHLHGIYQ